MSTFSESSGDLHYYPMRSDQAKREVLAVGDPAETDQTMRMRKLI